MELFYIIVTVIAIVFLILILTIIGILMRYQNKSTSHQRVSLAFPQLCVRAWIQANLLQLFDRN